MKFLKHRIADRKTLHLVEQFLTAGVDEDGDWSKTVVGLQPPVEILDQASQNAELRTDFLKIHEALGAEEVHKFSGSTAINKAALAGAWRTKGWIFGIENNNRQLYPVLQFDSTTGKPKPVIARILKAL